MKDEKIEKWMKIMLATIGITFGGLFLTGNSYFLDLIYLVIAEGIYMDYLLVKNIKKQKREARQ